MRFKKIISVLLAVVMMLSVIPLSFLNVFANSDSSTEISVKSTYAASGSEINVDLIIENNPGILGMTLNLEYDDKFATLTSIVSGEALSYMTFTPPKNLQSGCNLPWDAQDVKESDIKDGVIATLTFDVSEEAIPGYEINIDLSYTTGAIIDKDMNPIKVTVNSGVIKILDYTPGDLNEDGTINTTDVVFLRRYIAGGYGVTINEAAADVNDDGVLNTTDVVYIRRYVADDCVTDPNGYNITLKPSTPKCKHSMTAIPAVEATCTANGNDAYWYCSLCEKYFSDIDGREETTVADEVIPAGHSLTHVDAKAASYTQEGNIEHWYCSACEKYFADSSAKSELKKEDVYIPVIAREESTVVYNVYGSDPYLESVGVDNSKNETTFYSDEGLVLNDIVAPAGYIFKGWTTAAGKPITEIEPHATSRQIVLNANWDKVTYTVTFDSPDVPVEAVKYTVDTGATFENASWYGYTFVGWSNDDGFLVKNVKPGTTGNITLHANWTSNRNKATSYSNYGDPVAIIEDDATGQFLFVYNIGKIDNVPLSQIEYIGNSQTININQSYQVTNTITKTEAETVAEMISKATTESSGWTLSKDWNQLYEAGSEHDETRGKTQERTDSQGNVTGGNYYVSNSQGGASFVSTNSGGSSSNSSKVTKDASVGIHSNYKTSTETDASVSLGVKNETELSAGVKYGPASAGVKNTTTVSAETNASRNDKESFELDTQKSFAIGTVDESHSNSYYDVSVQNSSNWNTTSGYEKSYQSSQSTAVSNAISEQISEKTTLNISESVGGEVANSALSTDTSGKTNEYSTAFGYSEGTGEVTTKEVTFSSDRPGYYRLVTAGTAHVFGVVGYDVATDSYFTYTYSVLDNERHTYLDYSKADPNFKDCQNAVVPFEVPYYPNEYIMAVTGKSEGLQVNLDGYITGYTGTDSTVVIPQYWQSDNGDGTYSAIKIRGIAANYEDNNGELVTVFGGNTNIEKVILPKYVTEIPESAFEGCTSLETIFASGVTKIGANAFKDCSSLATFTIDEYVTYLGDGAFEGVSKLVVMAANPNVVDAVINSGANDITLNLSKLSGSIDDKVIKVSGETGCFTLISNGSVYKNLQIESKADETFLSNFSLVENKDTPLKLESEKVTLNRVTVQDAPGFALILPCENTEVKLYGNNNLSSKGDNAVLCKNVHLSLQNAAISSKLIVDGDLLCCGAIDGTSLLNISDGSVISISTEEFEQYMSSIIMTFDSNGGSEITTEIRAYYGQSYGELPVPTRANHGFVGWFTEAEGGTQITADSVVLNHVNQVLYAHWAPNQFTLTYNANGGSCSTATKSLTFGDSYGDLPIPTRTHYTFDGWYTDAVGGTKVSAETTPSVAENVTIYAHWTLVPYTASWSNGTGYTISVSRTSSPNANATIGTLSSGATIYYGDVLSVTYTASTGYSLSNKGITSITVISNLTSSDIYATTSLNSYTYNIVYRSSNGTALGSATATYKYGTTNTIVPKSFSGYTSPSSQSVKWDSTSAKTITFTYVPASVSTSQNVSSGTWWSNNGTAAITYSVKIEYRNRTATSVQVRVTWTNTIRAKYYYGYSQAFNASIGGVSTGNCTIATSSLWSSATNSARSTSATTGWVTVPVKTTSATTISVDGHYWDALRNNYWYGSFVIPAY
ncbi:MAG: InlB B-repeat-containing protein [Clostridia bacterium]|nr:InlB B-repeat-containing protein [Clostridia bacterium]